VAQPVLLEGPSDNTIGTVSLFAESTSLASRRGESAHFAVLVHGATNPIGAWVVANLLVVGIHEDDFVVLHGRILVDPVRVQDAQIGILASDLFFRDTLQVAFEFELVDTLVFRFTKDHTAMVLAFAASAADTGTDNHVALLGLVAQAVGLVGTGGAVARANVGALAVFPSAAVAVVVRRATRMVSQCVC
jgi:hypothetical protein